MTNEAASYYNATRNSHFQYPALTQDLDTDIAIIGGGFTGINAAIEFAEKGYSVVVLEQYSIGWGASGRNGGQVTGSLSGDTALLKELKKTSGAEAEDFVWHLRWRGHDIIKQRIEKYKIHCDLKFGHLHTAYKASHTEALKTHVQAMQQRGMSNSVRYIEKDEIPEYLGTHLYHGGILNSKNMHLHPLNLCLGEANAATALGVKIFEHSQVIDIISGEHVIVTTRQARIKANKVLLAGNAYHQLKPKQLGGKIFPAAGGVVATEPLSDELWQRINPKDLAVYDSRFVLDYYRLTADKRLLFGGGANYSGKPSRNITAELTPLIHHTFAQLKTINIDYAWSGMMGITINRIPQLGQLADNIYYAQGYCGHGIALTHIVAEIMANAITGEVKDFNSLTACKHIRIPGHKLLGNYLLVLGMWYYQMLEKLR